MFLGHLGKFSRFYCFDLQLVFGPISTFRRRIWESGLLQSCIWLKKLLIHIRLAQNRGRLPLEKPLQAAGKSLGWSRRLLSELRQRMTILIRLEAKLGFVYFRKKNVNNVQILLRYLEPHHFIAVYAAKTWLEKTGRILTSPKHFYLTPFRVLCDLNGFDIWLILYLSFS